MKQVQLWDEINEIRRLLTKPKMKTKEEGLKSFKEFVLTNHNFADLESPEAQNYLESLREWRAMDEILNWLEV